MRLLQILNFDQDDLIRILCKFGLGSLWGRHKIKKGLLAIEKLEQRLAHIKITTNKKDSCNSAQFISAHVVISQNYFNRSMSQLKGFFGKNSQDDFQATDLARRQALIKLKQQAHIKNSHKIIAVHFETNNVKYNQGIIEVIAYGMAVIS